MGPSTAQNLNQEQPTPEQPQQLPRQETKVHWSLFERLLVVVGGVVTLLLTVSLLSTKNTINNRQHHLQNLQTQISKAKSNNTSLQQEIDDLTSQANLKAAARKYGLSDKNSNVRNIDK